MTEIKLTWQAPTYRQDGTPSIADALGYELQYYEHEVGNIFPTIRRGNDEPLVISVDKAGEHGFRIRTTENGQFSEWTQWVSIQVPFLNAAPGKPLNFKVEIIT